MRNLSQPAPLARDGPVRDLGQAGPVRSTLGVEPVPAAQLLAAEAVVEDRAAVVPAALVLRADLLQHRRCTPRPAPAPCPAAGRRRRVQGVRRRPASTGRCPASRPACPAGSSRPCRPQPLQVRHARHVHLGLAAGPRRRVRSASSKWRPEVGHRGHRRRRCRQASFAPTITVTSSGLRVAACGHLPGQVGHPGAGHRRSSSCAAAASACPSSRTREAVDLGVGAGRPGDLGAVGQHRTGVEAAGDGVADGRDRARAAVPDGVRLRRRLRLAPRCRTGPAESPPTASQPADAHARQRPPTRDGDSAGAVAVASASPGPLVVVHSATRGTASPPAE